MQWMVGEGVEEEERDLLEVIKYYHILIDILSNAVPPMQPQWSLRGEMAIKRRATDTRRSRSCNSRE